jgi:hypothetical protein
VDRDHDGASPGLMALPPLNPALGRQVTSRNFSLLEMVERAWGAEWAQPDHAVYRFSGGRNFDSTDMGTTGIYRQGVTGVPPEAIAGQITTDYGAGITRDDGSPLTRDSASGPPPPSGIWSAGGSSPAGGSQPAGG